MAPWIFRDVDMNGQMRGNRAVEPGYRAFCYLDLRTLAASDEEQEDTRTNHQ